jgi:hypothetical protein
MTDFKHLETPSLTSDILGESQASLRDVNSADRDALVAEIERAPKVFCLGAGRSGILLQAFCMRFNQRANPAAGDCRIWHAHLILIMRFPKLFGFVFICVFLCLILIHGSVDYKKCAGEVRIKFASAPGFKIEIAAANK